jgi:HAMP domain-containing protein
MLAEAAAEEVALRELAGAELLTAGAPLGSSAGASARALLVRPVSDALLDYRELVGRFLVLAAASALLATGGAFLIARGVTRPIRILAQAAQRAAAGDYAAELPKASGGEIRRLAL